MPNYTDAAKIASHLGIALTAPQQAQAEVVAGAVTVWIDHRTGRSWQGGIELVVAEPHGVEGNTYYLYRVPVATIEQVLYRFQDGDSWTTADPSQYELTQPSVGQVTVVGWNTYATQTSYTPQAVAAPPADLAYAATVVSADVLFTMLHPESAGLEQLSIAQADISLRYATAADAERISGASLAIRVIDAYRRVVVA